MLTTLWSWLENKTLKLSKFFQKKKTLSMKFSSFELGCDKEDLTRAKEEQQVRQENNKQKKRNGLPSQSDDISDLVDVQVRIYEAGPNREMSTIYHNIEEEQRQLHVARDFSTNEHCYFKRGIFIKGDLY